MSNFTRRGFLQVAAASSAGAALAATSFNTAWAREARAALQVAPLAGGLSLITSAGASTTGPHERSTLMTTLMPAPRCTRSPRTARCVATPC